MPSVLPLGDPAPSDGLLPAQAADGAAGRAFGLYVHIPFCAVRCGYCDFNTYTATELGGGASQDAYASTAIAEVEFAAEALKASGLPDRRLSTVFFGGGTPTLLPAEDLARILTAAIARMGPGARRRGDHRGEPGFRHPGVPPAAGRRRLHPGVLRDAVGRPARAEGPRPHPHAQPRARRWCSGHGTPASRSASTSSTARPGESLEDWRYSLETALSYGPDHISAYALIVEDGTKLAAQIRRGEVPGIDDDDHADKYELADELISAAGLGWYEVSNWSRTPEQACRHNLAYWRGDDWWGIGPGAHSHVGGVRWWNVKHPTAYAGRLAGGASPAAGGKRWTPKPATWSGSCSRPG